MHQTASKIGVYLFVYLFFNAVLNPVLTVPVVPQFGLQHFELHHHLNAEVQEQLHPQLPECVSYRATHGHTRQHH